jgi:hypothetical protein
VLDEFDDDVEVEDLPHSAEDRTVECTVQPRVARLVSRLYGAASAPLRARMLACLVRPLGSLGLAAVASGAFAQLLYRGREADPGIPIGDLAGYSNDQIFELARFVEQVSPDAIQQVAGLLADNPVGASAFSAAVAMLLMRAVRGLRQKKVGTREETTARSEPSESGSPNCSSRDRNSFGHGSTTALNELVRRARERPAPDPTNAAGRP